MRRRSHFITIVLASITVFALRDLVFADAADDLKLAQTYEKKGQYEQAEAGYRQVVTAYPGSDQAFDAQKYLTALYALRGKASEAQEAMEKLLGQFSQREYLPLAVHEIVEKCAKSRGDEKVWQVCRNMLESTASGKDGIWSQMGLAILDIFLGGQLAAQATIDNLIADFSGDARSAEALGQVGWAYRKLQKHQKAAELYQYVVDNWSGRPRAVFSYRGLVYCKIALGDEAVAWAVVEDLLARFSGDEHIAEVAYSLGQNYDRLEQRDKARLLYEYILSKQPKSTYALWAQRGIVFMDIKLGNYQAAGEGIKVILAKYPDHNDLPQALQWLGNDYYRVKEYEKAANSYRYVVDNWPQSEYALGSQKGLILSSVKLKDGPSTNAAIDGLFAKSSGDEEVAQIALDLGDQCRHGLDDYAAARRLYEGLLARYPDSKQAMWAQRDIVFVDIKLGDYAAAESGIETMLAKYPDHNDVPHAMQWLGNDYYKVKEYEKAAKSYRRVVDNWPASQYALDAQKGLILSSVKLKDDPNTNAAIDDLFAKFAGRGDVARAAAEVADECRRDLREYAPARRLYEKLLARYPESTQAMRAQRGIVNIDIKRGNYEAAEAGVETLLAKYANHDGLPQAFCWLGNDYLDARQDEKAAQCYQYVIDNRPDSNAAMSSWAGIARVHIRRGDGQTAQDVIDKIIADFNDNPEVAAAAFQVGEEYYYRAFVDPNKCQTVKSEEDVNNAKDIWEKIIARCPESESIGLQHAHYFAGVCCRKLGQYDKAIGYYQKLIDKWPKYQYAWSAQCLIGECYENLKQSGEVAESAADPNIVEAYKRVIENYPDCSLVGHASLKLANINFKASQWDEAATYFGLFLEKFPEDIQKATALYHLGKTYENMGEFDTATEVYRMFLEGAEPGDYRIGYVTSKLEEVGGQK
jgi:TolA-binding protein